MQHGSPKGLQAAEYLRQEILTGQLPAGTRLRQAALATRLGISQIPLREAMRVLLDEGLVRILPYVGAVVTPLLPEEILESARIRILLECDALELAAAEHTPATLARARACWETLASARTALARYEAMRTFLEALYAPARRPMQLEQILAHYRRTQLTVTIQDQIIARLDPATPRPIAILASLEAGDLETAKERLRLLYRHAAIHAAALLYERQLAVPRPVPAPRGRPRKLR